MRLSRRAVFAGLATVAAQPRFSLAQEDGLTVITAEARQVQLLAASQPATTVWQYSQPVLRVKQGEEARFRFINKLGVELWLHWFGVRGPDAVMTINVPPDESAPVDCMFTPPDAGSFWLGPLTSASQLRDMGLSAMLVVEGPGDDAYVDQPMIIDDWMIAEDGKIEAGFGDLKAAIGDGRIGNWFTLNGRQRPELALPAGKLVRLRFLNAANARSMRVVFKGPTPWLAALDGQPVAAAQLADGLLALAPGQRADLLLDAPPQELTVGLELFEETAELCHITRNGDAGVAVVTPGLMLPANPISTALDLASAQVVPVVLQGGAKGGMTKAKLNGVEMELRGLLEQGKAWAINGEVGPGGASLGTFALASTVVFDISNETAFDQPLHLHGHVWQLLEENGEPLKTLQPWRDTTVVSTKGRQKLAFVADNPGVWVLQSLVAERCDSGLISAFRVG